jgi:hypothetical protein
MLLTSQARSVIRFNSHAARIPGARLCVCMDSAYLVVVPAGIRPTG